MDNNDKDTKNKKRKYGKGFYVIFTLCMLTMAGAAFSAYNTVSNYMQPSEIETKLDSSTSSIASEPIVESSTESVTEATEIETVNVANQSETALPTEAETETSTEDQTSDSNYFYPVSGEVIKKYSGVTPVKSSTFGDYRTHTGTDFKSEKDASVYMITTGTVQAINEDQIMGGVIVTENNDGSIITYCGVTPSEGLKIGSHLSSGDVIGKVGEIAGESKDGIHIHVEVSENGEPVDPEEFLNNHNAQ